MGEHPESLVAHRVGTSVGHDRWLEDAVGGGLAAGAPIVGVWSACEGGPVVDGWINDGGAPIGPTASCELPGNDGRPGVFTLGGSFDFAICNGGDAFAVGAPSKSRVQCWSTSS